MSPANRPGITVFGRRVQWVALGMTILMVTLVVINVANSGVLEATPLGDVVAVLAATSAALLVAGWWSRVHAFTELGLLAAGAVYAARAVFILLLDGPVMGVFLSVGACVIAFGSYLSERESGQPRRWAFGPRVGVHSGSR